MEHNVTGGDGRGVGGGSCVGPLAAGGDGGSGPLPGYFGSKGAAGVAQQIISRMPPHSIYAEVFLGGGAVLRRKVPALTSIGVDADARVIQAWRAAEWPGLQLIHGDAIAWLEGPGLDLPADALVYADPPYPHSCRQSRRRYRCELSEADHWRLLSALNDLPCSVMISSYNNPLYRSMLRGWAHATFPGMTRGGVRQEHLWSRSTIAAAGVGTRYAGSNFRERERIKRKAARWASMWRAMPPAERGAVLGAVLAAAAAIDAGGDEIC
jgi:DNA adenine methylase